MDLKFQGFFKEKGYTDLTAIQEAVYHPLKERENVLGLAPTGSGKTLAYVIPLLEGLLQGQGIQMMVVAPSQELAIQIAAVVTEWASLKKLKTVPLIGGANVKRQLEKLKKKPEIIVGTPGRMLELADAKKLKLHKLRTAVFDEADDLLTEETLTACRALLNHAPSRQVQLSFFSATNAAVFSELSQLFAAQVKTYDVRAVDKTQGKVTHYLLETPTRKRIETLRRLSHLKGFRALVFFKQVAELEEALEKLRYQKVAVAALEGQNKQQERKKALIDLRNSRISLLLTTDVAARGLDIEQLPAVVNYDLPANITVYIHRVGRTGRMGAQGAVINLGNEHALRNFRQLLKAGGYEAYKGEIFSGKLFKKEDLEESEKLSGENKKLQKHSPKRLPHRQISSLDNAPVEKKRKGHKKRRRDQLNKGKRHGSRSK
ncbi:DEAD/DEAH box helicase [Liquorilactobacillus oeni]|nr:DEAD/DEAH box helicase [Liquorilactobacillus oeni]